MITPPVDAGTTTPEADAAPEECPAPCVETLVVTPNPISLAVGGRVELTVEWENPLGDRRPAEFTATVVPETLALVQNGALIGTEAGRGTLAITSEEQFVEIDLTVTVRWTNLSAGTDHMCATIESGETYCWGSPYERALGTGFRVRSRIATKVATDESFEALCAQSRATMAVDGIGDLFGWGYSRNDQVGRSSWDGYDVPDRAFNDAKFVRIDCGIDHACGVRVDGQVSCWGPNTAGEVDPATVGERDSNHRIAEDNGAPVSSYSDVAAGALHTCAAGTEGGVWCWGDDSRGQFTRANAMDQFVEVLATDVVVKDLTAGLNHTCALVESGEVLCWGDNSKGQLGTTETGSDVVTVIDDRVVSQLGSSLGDSTCVLDENGIVGCWGDNSKAQLGAGDATSRPGEVVWHDELGEMVEVVTGSDFACARAASGSVLCWGSNERWQQGRWDIERAFEPTAIPDPLTPTFINIDPTASYLMNAAAGEPVIVSLEEIGVESGDLLDLTTVNFYDKGDDDRDDDRDLVGVFSSSDEIADRSERVRVIGAIGAGEGFETDASSPLSSPTDIPEDFDARSTLVTVPEGARFLILGVDDSRYDDNVDLNGDYALRITMLPILSN